MDGARPLATSAKRTADRVPADVRRAVALRDRGDRMPGSRAPVAWTDVHHIREQGKGGDHSPDNLVRLRTSSCTGAAGATPSTRPPACSPSNATAAPTGPSPKGHPSPPTLRPDRRS